MVADEWYYSRDTQKFGPFSALQLIELAQSGQIRPTDTVWKAGVERGMVAAKMSRLFAPVEPAGVAEDAGETQTDQAVVSAPPPAPETSDPAAAELVAPVARSAADKPPVEQKQVIRKGRAMAVRGAVIVGQDGQSVQFRKKCVKCGHEDASKSRLPIRQGITRAGFFCPKCRKLMPVEIQGVV
jgi:hypothetical protein